MISQVGIFEMHNNHLVYRFSDIITHTVISRSRNAFLEPFGTFIVGDVTDASRLKLDRKVGHLLDYIYTP